MLGRMSSKSWLAKPIQGVLLDISGVLKNGDLAIDGSIEAFKRLRSANIPVRLVTNETQLARPVLQEKLRKLGFDVSADEIFAPAPAMVAILKKNGLRPHLLIHPKLASEFAEVDTTDPNCLVIADAAEYFTYQSMNEAFRFMLKQKEKKFFTLGRGKYFFEDGVLMLDVGPFTAGLEYALEIQAELVGKPANSFFQIALDDMKLKAESVIMIGDDIVGDVGGAQKSGMRGILVRTGKFQPHDEKHPTVTPDAIVDNLAQAVEFIIQAR